MKLATPPPCCYFDHTLLHRNGPLQAFFQTHFQCEVTVGGESMRQNDSVFCVKLSTYSNPQALSSSLAMLVAGT